MRSGLGSHENQAILTDCKKAKGEKLEILVFTTIAEHMFKKINGKYILTVARGFKSAYYPGRTVSGLFTPKFKILTSFDDLLERAQAQVAHEASLKARYWNGTVQKKSLEVPIDSEAAKKLWAGSSSFLWVPEYRENK